MQFRESDQVMARIGTRIALDIGDGVDDAKLLQFKYFLGNLVTGESRPTRRIHRPVWAAVAVAVVLGSAALYWRVCIRNPEAPFFINGMDRVGTLDTPLTAPSKGALALYFPLKSKIVLRNGATAQMVESRQKSVRLHLSRGDLSADVNKARNAGWSIETGRYTVVVVGTRFTVSYDPDADQLDVKVQRGTVRVLGTGTADDILYVTEGTHLRVDGTGHVARNNVYSEDYDPSEMGLVRSSHNGGPSPANLGIAVVAATPAESDDMQGHTVPRSDETVTVGAMSGDSMSTAMVAVQRPGRGGRSADIDYRPRRRGIPVSNGTDDEVKSFALRRKIRQWIRRMAEGEYEAVLREAETGGMETLIADADAENLWQLMHAARKIGWDTTAIDMLNTCRERFPNTQKAHLAAFVLGTEYEKKSRLREARRWFERYLDEDPMGELAEDAKGRIMIIHQEQGDDEGAREVARRYLRDHPGGSFKNVARSILGR